MITRSHICLRCQLRLTKELASRVRSHTTESKLSADSTAPLLEENEEYIPFPSFRRPLGARSLQVDPRDPRIPVGRLYGHLGNKLSNNRERLEINALGSPAEVIVLRESKLNYYAHGKIIDSEEQEKVDILKQVDSERGLIRQAEVENNINEFRPKDGFEPQTWADLNALVEALQKGFTTSQLDLYIKNHVKSATSARADVKSRGKSSAFLRRGPWLPDLAQTSSDFADEALRGYVLESHTAKQRVVIRLLRECWDLSLPSLEEGIGQVEATMSSKDLDFLLRGSQSLLSEISANHISNEQEKIEIFRSRSVIRITAPRAKAEAVILEIENTIKEIRRIDVPVPALLSQRRGSFLKSKRLMAQTLGDTTLQELSRITNTDIAKPSKHKLVISCLEEDKLETSNQAERARNLLVASIRPSNRTTCSLETKHNVSRVGAYVKYPSTEGLGWHERLRDWTRWTVPVLKDSGELWRASTTSRYERAERDTPKTWIRPRGRHDPWSVVKGTSSSALIGSILHHHENDGSADSRVLKEEVVGKIIRGFSTRVPNLTQLIRSMSTERWRPITSAVLRLLPSPFHNLDPQRKAIGFAALSSFPPIEMRIRINEKTDEVEANVQAVLHENLDDVMLPDRAVDLRFQRRWTSLFNPESDRIIKKFLGGSILDLVGGRVETPATLTLPISEHLCVDDGFQLLTGGTPAAEEGNAQVTYLVVGHEKRSTVPFKFDGWDLLYTSIDAGEAGGRRSELKLLPDPNDSPEKSQSDFVAASLRLVELISNPQLLTQVRNVKVKKSIGGEESESLGSTGLEDLTVEKHHGNHGIDQIGEDVRDEYFVESSW